jgi:hypothetical protein
MPVTLSKIGFLMYYFFHSIACVTCFCSNLSGRLSDVCGGFFHCRNKIFFSLSKQDICAIVPCSTTAKKTARISAGPASRFPTQGYLVFCVNCPCHAYTRELNYKLESLLQKIEKVLLLRILPRQGSCHTKARRALDFLSLSFNLYQEVRQVIQCFCHKKELCTLLTKATELT